MKKFVKKFLHLFTIAILACGLCTPVLSDVGNIVTGDIGDYGAWTTEHNREELVNAARQDFAEFGAGYEREYIETGVPVEAKLGITFISGLSYVAKVLDNSLIRFVKIFLIVAFIFWVMFEAYRLITDSKVRAMPTFYDIVKKGITLGLWLIVLGFGLQRLFGEIMGPIISFGSYLANMILDTVAESGGFVLSDTCAAVRDYAATHMKHTNIIDTEFAANIVCLPTRMSGFYYGAIKFGWQLMHSGLGLHTFTFVAGAILVGVFTYTAFKFAFVAFGVIAELFLVVIMLPFTAIAETINKTSYKGIAGDIYNGFLGLFKNFNLSSQVKKFIDASVHFVSLAIVVAVGGALLKFGIDVNHATHTLQIANDDTIVLIITGALVAYIAAHTEDIAKQIGGAIDYTLGSELKKDITTLYNDTKKKTTEFIKALKKK